MEEKEEEDKEKEEVKTKIKRRRKKKKKRKRRRRTSFCLCKGFLSLGKGQEGWEHCTEALRPSGTTAGHATISRGLQASTTARRAFLIGQNQNRTITGTRGAAPHPHTGRNVGHLPSFSSSLRTCRSTGCRFMYSRWLLLSSCRRWRERSGQPV